MTEERKVFDDYEVECNTCEKYWINQCDGVKPGEPRKCNSYVAVRKMDVVQQIDKNTKDIKFLKNMSIFVQLLLLFHLLSHLVW